jgi:hypothetical protein
MPPLPASYERARQALDWIGATAPSRSCLARCRSHGSCFPRPGRASWAGLPPSPPMLRRPQFRHPPLRRDRRQRARAFRVDRSPSGRPAASHVFRCRHHDDREPGGRCARSELDARPAARSRGGRPDAGQRPRRRCGRGGSRRVRCAPPSASVGPRLDLAMPRPAQ